MNDERYWIAINGSSCAIAPFPLRRPLVTPMPEFLVGFPSAQEAKDAQHACLNAPIPDVAKLARTWLERDDVRVIRCPNPGKQTDGFTVWEEMP